MRKVPAHNSINVMPAQSRVMLLPYTVVKILTGARADANYEGKRDVVAVNWSDTKELMHVDDFRLAKKVADALWKEYVEEKGMLSTVLTLPTGMYLHRIAQERIKRRVDKTCAGKKTAILIKDKSGCGYWRMVVPARYMDEEKYHLECAEVEVVYDYLLEYDTIVVQRVHNWAEFYVIEKLKRAGKRVVYDIDDDIFNIPPDNPASQIILPDHQGAARAIMNVADLITTPSEVIRERFGFPDKTVVIPNALDLDDGYPVLSGDDAEDLDKISSPDEWRRILWQGSPTHAQDWFECAQAVDQVMEMNDDVRLTILGFLPPVVQSFVEDESRPWWSARVEFEPFSEVETYIQTTKHLRAEVALAPLTDHPFNAAKSALKFVEYSAVGAPCVASNVTPYKEVMRDGENGRLASTPAEWLECIQMLLDSGSERVNMVREARKTVREGYDIKKVAKQWERAIFG